jgi:sec-independent protein translocase protein TatA
VPNIGPTELIIVLVIVLLIFGPKRLPGLGKQLGTGMREFKDSVTRKVDENQEQPPALPSGDGTENRTVDGEVVREHR